MARSHKQCPSAVAGCKCCSTFGIKYHREKHLSQRSSKRKTKEFLNDSSRHISDALPSREYVHSDVRLVRHVEKYVDLKDYLSYLECYDEERNEGLRNIEKQVKNEMMEEWKLMKPSHVVKKAIKKLEREGEFTIFDNQEIELPKECKKRIVTWENQARQIIREAKKYEQTGSLSSFNSYRIVMKK
ncbi:predicted protein [Naegleria gruberi]|uniref:Predicted protein n=1 Tax=Naegleria gruberi TaxID=5762 RepID=D2W5G0_NAEGR|nr:uncharacterized protein NAEGRDRAFT_76652 [Naegleria gruberi]EFC35689.1 predicted protein [Naegleria gruberi]|eukprot:XP_002668433.1 predicted protein [Naegleria gruberi strain NEG-M]